MGAGYPELPQDPRATEAGTLDVGISCGEHCDYGCLTIVNQDNVPGALQVKRADGSWIDADVVDGCFVVNIGDMLCVDFHTEHLSLCFAFYDLNILEVTAL